MMRSPCSRCRLLHEDKNNPICDDCMDRLAYVMAMEHGPDGGRDGLALYGYELSSAMRRIVGSATPWSQTEYIAAQYL